MGRLSRNKGKIGEREFCKKFKEATGINLARTAQHCGKTGAAGDVEGLTGVHFEIKRTERLNLKQAMAQAIRDADANTDAPVPVVAHRMSRQPWLVTVRLEDLDHFVHVVNEAIGIQQSAELDRAVGRSIAMHDAAAESLVDDCDS